MKTTLFLQIHGKLIRPIGETARILKKKKKYNWLIVEEAGWLVMVLEVPT
jgi:hypothetical protein